MKKAFLILSVFIFTISGCEKYEYESTWMDSASTKDKSLTNPMYLVSKRPIINEEMLKMPVIICTHGFTSSTYEWEEFAEYAEGTGNVLVSNVLLGGHGRSVEEFKKSTWEDWQKPIIDEYKALSELGYTNINLAGSSAGGALILEMLLSGKISDFIKPNNIFLIDPFVIPADTNIGFISIVGIFIKNIPNNELSEKAKEHWYYNRPVNTLIELNDLITRVRSGLEIGFELPVDTWLITYKIIDDVASDPQCIILFANGISAKGTGKVEAHLYDSSNHIFTRGYLRDVWTDYDETLQMNTFNDIVINSMH